MGRLVRAKGPPGQQYAYAYDHVGNRVKALWRLQPGQTSRQNLRVDWAGRLTSLDGTPVTHDAAGNLTAMSFLRDADSFHGGTPGGPGGPGGGGPGSPGGPGGGDLRGSSNGGPSFSSMTPSSVGGVYLGGASQSLDAIGLLEGITLDANHNLVLLTQTGETISLPPLRLDDVVTVFRSVYLHGEGPTVTIDPNPEKPEESAMIIRHSKATADTYVGWILFQADRLMKAEFGGRNDIHGRQPWRSKLPLYPIYLLTTNFEGLNLAN